MSKAVTEAEDLGEVIVHIGQHFYANVSDIFFDQLDIPRPHYKLNINGGSHSNMTGRILIEIEKLMLQEKPDCVLLYGDISSTLAGALAAAKLHFPLAYFAAGLRSLKIVTTTLKKLSC